jgi:hypothetical protein
MLDIIGKVFYNTNMAIITPIKKAEKFDANTFDLLKGVTNLRFVPHGQVEAFVNLIMQETIAEFGRERANLIFDAIRQTPIVIYETNLFSGQAINSVFVEDKSLKISHCVLYAENNVNFRDPFILSTLLHEFIHVAQTNAYFTHENGKLYFYYKVGANISKREFDKAEIYDKGIGINEGLTEYHAINICDRILGSNDSPTCDCYMDSWVQVHLLSPQQRKALDDLAWEASLPKALSMLAEQGMINQSSLYNFYDMPHGNGIILSKPNEIFEVLDAMHSIPLEKRSGSIIHKLRQQIQIANRNANKPNDVDPFSLAEKLRIV